MKTKTHVFIVAIILLAACTGDKKPDISLDQFQLAEGFEMELFAAEPLVSDPVDMEIDENGNMYVVEMHGYPLEVQGSGVVKQLIDTNGDGLPDESRVFADGLILPTSIMRWKKGFLVTDAPDLLYLEDTDGDGKADIKEVVLTGFALSNPQHNVNSPVYGLDNWIYLAHENSVHTVQFDSIFGDKGETIRFPGSDESLTLPTNALGKSVRFKNDPKQLELMSSHTQFGHDFDNFGRYYLVSNSRHIYQEIMPVSYLQRKPQLTGINPVAYIPEHGNNAEVFSITKNAEHQLLTDLGVFTAACGIALYNADLFPEEYRGMSFVAEPTHNLIHVDVLTEDGVPFKAQRMFPDKEFLASEDPWFRPVNFYVGPDGALYLIDYYRKIIEHPEWMADEVTNSDDLYAGVDKGRIYRIKPKGSTLNPIIGKKQIPDSPMEQVKLLSHPNRWHRINAQRMLVDNKTANVGASVRQLLSGKDSVAMAHALWTLEGRGELQSGDVLLGLESKSTGVLENAIRLSEEFLKNEQVTTRLVVLASEDISKRAAFQLALTLGYLRDEASLDATNTIMEKYIDDPWIVPAVMTGVQFDAIGWMEKATDVSNASLSGNHTLIENLAYLITLEGHRDKIKEFLTRGAKEQQAPWVASFINGVSRGLNRAGADIAGLGESKDLLFNAFKVADGTMAARWSGLIRSAGISLEEEKYNNALIALISDQDEIAEKRAAGLSLLINADNSQISGLIAPDQPTAVQNAALAWLSSNTASDEDFCRFVINGWAALSPGVRTEAINFMVRNNTRIDALLTAIEGEKISTTAVGWRRSVRLMTNNDEPLRLRARALFDPEKQEGEDLLATFGDVNNSSGDIKSGQEMFVKHCGLCHTIGEQMGSHFGPDIALVKNQSKAAILKHIVQPELAIADGFELWTVTLKDGQELQGIITAETATALTLNSSAETATTVQRSNIESISVLDISAMPTGLSQVMSTQEMIDLLEFIKTYKSGGPNL